MPEIHRVVVTGFPGLSMENTPSINPSGLVAQSLDGTYIDGYRVKGLVVNWGVEERPLHIANYARKHRTAALLGTGIGNQGAFMAELRGENFIDTRDNPGQIGGPRRVKLIEGDEEAYEIHHSSLLPMERDFAEAGLPFRMSHDAGKLGCEAMTYGLNRLGTLSAHKPDRGEYPGECAAQPSSTGRLFRLGEIASLFLHIPYTTEYADWLRQQDGDINPLNRNQSIFSLPMESVQLGVTIALRHLVRSALSHTSYRANPHMQSGFAP